MSQRASSAILSIALSHRRTTLQLGAALGSMLQAGDLVLLEGALGTGKTFLTRAILRALGISSSVPITSPTFGLVHEYDGRVRVLHADLYRLEDERDVARLGLREARDDGALLIAEWAERFAGRTSDASAHGQGHTATAMTAMTAMTTATTAATGTTGTTGGVVTTSTSDAGVLGEDGLVIRLTRPVRPAAFGPNHPGAPGAPFAPSPPFALGALGAPLVARGATLAEGDAERLVGPARSSDSASGPGEPPSGSVEVTRQPRLEGRIPRALDTDGSDHAREATLLPRGPRGCAILASLQATRIFHE